MKHEQLKGIVSMRSGHSAGASCSCGWHSHSRTFEQHLSDIKIQQALDDDAVDRR